ncbi:hypothetical protein DMB65_04445 [Flavobacterium cheongpyeongense]|uniref:Uncharacterized protein n=1 Tax=Flavobacterium cheongpyeongense TaxID=2212651 RepID=A0A2V4BRX7_9FLAO|nr:hypothetical protein [Flavobacterium cheongpyeongense]PXY41819.1 hypothetical protein DMB65_04445 [Flavobacterium cheongpyeongense]
MNEIFKIRPNGFEDMKKQLIIKSVPTLLLSMTFGIAIVFFNSKEKEDVLDVLPFMIPICLFALGYGLYKGLKRQKMLFESYKLIFSENNVVREQVNTPIINIQFSDIQSITKDKKGGYVIKGKSAVETILIPAQIDNYENLEILCNQIKPIEEFQQPKFDEKYRIPFVLLTLCCMAIVYVSDNKILVGVSALIVSGMLISSFIKIRKNKNIDNKTKRSSYYSLLVLVSVLIVTIMKIISK